ncbi:MAG: glycosyltransferase family 2 protein [Lachnospiraceae bacterium]|nr:glycosyltransferase family 2 protein [Lachnospiraceae bacterium]
MPKVSVLIPVFNGEKYLAEAIESVLNQTFKEFELIIVDDGSTDDSGIIAESYPSVQYIRKQHSGVSDSRNAAVKNAAGEWIVFLDADDVLEPDALEKEMAFISSHPECDILFCKCRNFTELPDEQLTERQKVLLSAKMDNIIPGACIRKELFEKYGAFDTKYHYGEDTEWVTRLKLQGVDFSNCLDEDLYLRRIHNENISLGHKTPGKKEYLSLMAAAIRNRKQGS